MIRGGIRMKQLNVQVNNQDSIGKFLSVLAIGISESIKNKKLTVDEGMLLLFLPFPQLEIVDEVSPILREAIQMGTELEDIESLFPERLESNLENIKQIAEKNLTQLPNITGLGRTQYELIDITSNSDMKDKSY